MIPELIERLKTWAKETAAAVMAKLTAAAHKITSLASVVLHARALIVASEGNVLNTGKRYRLMSGHAPVFSY
jgi:hypothetical protein